MRDGVLALILFSPFILAFGIAVYALVKRKVVQPWADYRAIEYVYNP